MTLVGHVTYIGKEKSTEGLAGITERGGQHGKERPRQENNIEMAFQ
jgi:hypothetical protein